jgi:hypothetical protein
MSWYTFAIYFSDFGIIFDEIIYYTLLKTSNFLHIHILFTLYLVKWALLFWSLINDKGTTA